MLTIAIDCDGVMCDFTGGILEFVNTTLRPGSMMTDADITQWNVSTALGLTEKEDALLVERIKSKGFCAGLAVTPGTVDALAALRNLGRVICVTSPYPSEYWEWERRQWLGKLGFQKKDIVFADDKSLVKADILLDDKLETIKAWKHGWSVLFEQPWNTCPGVMDEEELMRVSNWAQFINMCHFKKSPLAYTDGVL